jgi:hypothetical protein
MTTSTKKIPKRIVDKMDKMFRDYSYNSLDSDYAFAYHPRAMGLTLDEWISFIEDYAIERDRKYFFAYNEYQRPTVFFDSSNQKEWEKNQKLSGREQVRFWETTKGEKRTKPKNKINRFVKIKFP